MSIVVPVSLSLQFKSKPSPPLTPTTEEEEEILPLFQGGLKITAGEEKMRDYMGAYW